jgi:hypothetical protein
MVFGLQGSVSIVEYIQQLVDISQKFGSLVEGTSNINYMTEGTIMLYLMSIHPRQFSVVGNVSISDEELQMLSFIWGDCTLGEAKPLFGIRTK